MASKFTIEQNVPRGTFDLFRLYAKEIIRWNASVNLVSKHDSTSEDRIIERHILDSLQVSNFIRTGDVVLDIGSGAGFPGFVIALLGGSFVTLIEPNYKKAAFLRHIAQQFSVSCKVEQTRSEEYFHSPKNVDVITSRAFASITCVVASSIHNFSKNTKIILFKSASQLSKELKEFSLLYDFSLQVFQSEINTESRIVILSKIRLK